MQQQLQEKTTIVAAASSSVDLNIHKGKSKILRYNTAFNNRITLDGEDLQDVKSFTYLGSIIDEHGGSDANVKAQNTSDPLVRYYQQQSTVGENKPDSSGERIQEEALEVDRVHIEESNPVRHEASPHMESSRPKEKRKTKEHIRLRNGDRHEKTKQQLDRIRNEGAGPSGYENAGRRPMLHWV
ncbi:unnamed protein product [Schistosoma curassoni]|uniref:Hva1_TUDOR domain-containing protein n=1 Tax=Schistosoma curassoni TaxID=6186 RepID=A0A183KUI3_9TREM|nr:unnamed protein product [Schistosoma curassoni]